MTPEQRAEKIFHFFEPKDGSELTQGGEEFIEMIAAEIREAVEEDRDKRTLLEGK